MTPIVCCGFECGTVSNEGGSHVLFLNGSSAFDTGTVRSGARSLRVNPTAGTSYVEISGTISGGSSVAIMVWRLAVRFATLPDSTTQITTGINSTRYPGAYFNVSDSKIYAGTAGPTALGASGVSVTTGIWYVVSVKIDLSANPWTVDVTVDGAVCGQATLAVAASTCGTLRHGMQISTTADVFYDDYLSSHTSGDHPLGDGYINHFVPTSDGTHNISGGNDFERGTLGTDILNSTTDAYLLVDEVPFDSGTPDTDDYINCAAPFADTDYVELKYGPAPGISTPSVAPRLVSVLFVHHDAGTGNRSFGVQLNDNGTEDYVYVITGGPGSASLQYKRKSYAVAPSTSAPWTLALFNNLRLRFGYCSDANPDIYLDGTMIEAEFAPVVAGARQRLHIIEED